MLGTDRPLLAETSVPVAPAVVVVVCCSFPFLSKILFVGGGVLAAVDDSVVSGVLAAGDSVAVEIGDGCVSVTTLVVVVIVIGAVVAETIVLVAGGGVGGTAGTLSARVPTTRMTKQMREIQSFMFSVLNCSSCTAVYIAGLRPTVTFCDPLPVSSLYIPTLYT